MATNVYFTQGTPQEQNLYEDLIIESLKIYGQDVYYIPREIVKRDRIFEDDAVSRFDNAYRIEMYIENVEGFDGEGDLFSKFGIEIRDAATFILARRRWHSAVSLYENTDATPFFRPREGDLIYLILSGSIFEITGVDDETPFYQLKDLPVFRMRAELFDYNDEDFDTGIDIVDAVESVHAQHNILSLNLDSASGPFIIGENISQVNGTYTIQGEIADIDASDSDNYRLYVAHNGATDGEWHQWTLTGTITGDESLSTAIPYALDEDLQDHSQNADFETEGDLLISFDESNPFGEP